ncbi:response regulator transcription factor [Galbibacter orientalis]|uniref:Response regulator containing a CheY-like receiver domain and an HTH DNA-binding domain n=1 Tax=Galbibacter orientalis DSM 19592 TaxID=926559 RepID=I3C8W3_9FLAO|nr:response regulator transcription factor [Galbibacter orientalis]EIJ40056.1 response regulator containing a CheY-like receiver domain and an HTH DNA-binding domain [Galbibacter orientalis DSM 19592]
MEHINIILADDHVLVRDGIKSLLEDDKSIHVIDEASNGKEALEIIAKNKPDLLVVDIRMPEMNGIEVVKRLKKSNPEVKALVLSMHDSEEYVVQSIQSGADGYLLKGSSKEEFLKALHTVAEGGKYFSGDVSSIIINNFVDGKPKKVTDTSVENDFNLTKREKQILKHVLKGLSNKEIAEELKISKRTAEVHRFNLMKKLEVKNQMELANKANTYNLL